MTITLVEALPADPATGAVVPVRMAGGGTSAYAQFGHLDWLAGIVAPPRFTTALGFGPGGWTGGAIPKTTTLAFAPSRPATLAPLARLYWDKAAVRVWTAQDGGVPVLVLTGSVDSAPAEGGVMTLTLSDLAGKLALPLLTTRFAGTGGIEGDVEAAGRDRRRSFGRVFNVEARLLLKASNTYEVGDPHRPSQAIPVVRDKGRAWPVAVIAWAGSIDATLAMLVASPVPAGGALVAPSINCVRWWTQPAGPLTADVHGEIGAGYVETAPAIAARIIAEAGMETRDLDAAIARRPGVAGLHIAAISDTGANALDRLLLGASLQWVVEADGGVRLLPWAFDRDLEAEPWAPAPAGGSPWSGAPAAGVAWGAVGVPRLQSRGVQRVQVYPPVKSRRVGYRRNAREHDAGEIAADILSSDLRYDDGTPIEALKPSEPGAQITRAIDADASTITIALDAAGAVAGGQLPRSVRFTATAASANVSMRTSWSLSTVGGVTATIDDADGSTTRGVATITGVTGPGSITALALVDGTFLSKTVTVTTKGPLADKGTAGTGDIDAGAVSRTAFAATTADVACPRAQPTTVIGFTFAKVDAGSVLEILMYAHCYNQDDLDFTGTLYLDGQVLQSFPIRMPFDNAGSRGQTTVTPMALLPGIGAGNHDVAFAMTSHETEGPTIVRAGAILKVTELRAPSAAGVQSGSGSAGGGSSGGGTGGGSGGGGDVPAEVV